MGTDQRIFLPAGHSGRRKYDSPGKYGYSACARLYGRHGATTDQPEYFRRISLNASTATPSFSLPTPNVLILKFFVRPGLIP